MVALSLWPIAKWLRVAVSRSSQKHGRRTSLFSSLAIPLGECRWVLNQSDRSATTHTDLVLRAREKGIAVEIVHNASILNAVGACGLQLYNFGQTVSMVFFTETWQPASYYDRVAENAGLGLHTLLLLDIKVKEPTLESLARGRSGIFEPPRYMSAAQCAQQMLITEAQRGQGVCHANRLAVAVARLGAQDQRIVAGTLSELASLESNGPELGPPLHSLVLLGSRTHPLERDYIRPSALDSVSFDTIWHRDYETK